MRIHGLFEILKRFAAETQALAGYSVRLAVRLIGRPFYVAETLDQMYFLGVGSLFLVVLTGIFAGQGLALQFSIELAEFGSKNYLGRVMVIAIVRELGPVLTGLMVAARVAAGITAEIGSMKSSEQIDALVAFGVDPIRRLAVPRFWAILLMLPILTICCDFVAIVGGWVIAVYIAHISSTAYWTNIISKLSLGNFVIGLGKPFLFAVIISTISTFMGFRTMGGTRGVGRSTTNSVVACSITILFVNFLFTRLIVPQLKGLL
ncbi:MAG TPA: ABC transporter permease [candidate division Zixibacteria bacterium]|jgi:phospholipid/cholesterol/gamma-HCH transport system permease protein